MAVSGSKRKLLNCVEQSQKAYRYLTNAAWKEKTAVNEVLKKEKKRNNPSIFLWVQNLNWYGYIVWLELAAVGDYPASLSRGTSYNKCMNVNV